MIDDSFLYFNLEGVSHPNDEGLKLRCDGVHHFKIDTNVLQYYTFHNLNEFDVDVLLVIAAVEYADRRIRRCQGTQWSRSLSLDVAVFRPEHWNKENVRSALSRTLNILTGDCWSLKFHQRRSSLTGKQRRLPLESQGPYSILPYSDGMDSMLLGLMLPSDVKQMRLTAPNRAFRASRCSLCDDGYFRISIPIRTIFHANDHPEPSFRSRSFKFLMVCALAAWWTNSDTIFIPENGQGIIGPVLTPKGLEYDYLGSHPLFTYELGVLVQEVLGVTVQFVHPNIWKTKGTVLKEAICSGAEIPKSMSCVMDSRQGFGLELHCGICSNCLLRRVSLHAAGVNEKHDRYYYSNLNGRSLQEMSRCLEAHREHRSHLDIAFHAIQSMERFSKLASLEKSYQVDRHAFELSEIGFCSEEAAASGMRELITTHNKEWESFVSNLSSDSWIRTKLREIR